MVYLHSYNENAANRRNYFRKLMSDIDPTLETLFRAKILGNENLKKLSFETTGGLLDKDTKIDNTDPNKNYGVKFTTYNSSSDTQCAKCYAYEYKNRYSETIEGVCEYLKALVNGGKYDKQGNFGMLDPSMHLLSVRFRYAIWVHVDRNKYFVKIESKIYYDYDRIMDIDTIHLGNHLFNIKKMDSKTLLLLVNSEIEKWETKFNQKIPSIETDFEELIDKKYQKLANLIGEGTGEKIVKNVNYVKDNYPEVYSELEKRIYKSQEINKLNSMDDKGFND